MFAANGAEKVQTFWGLVDCLPFVYLFDWPPQGEKLVFVPIVPGRSRQPPLTPACLGPCREPRGAIRSEREEPRELAGVVGAVGECLPFVYRVDRDFEGGNNFFRVRLGSDGFGNMFIVRFCGD